VEVDMKTRLPRACTCALALLVAPFAACDDRPPVTPDEPTDPAPVAPAAAAPAPAAAAPAPTAAPPVPTVAAPAPPAAPDTAAPTPRTLEVVFEEGLMADMGDAFQQSDYTSAVRKIGDSMTIHMGEGPDLVSLAAPASVQPAWDLPAKPLALVFGGARPAPDAPAGTPGTAYDVAAAIYDAMKVPDKPGYGTVTRVSPGGRVHCTTLTFAVSVTCELTGVIEDWFSGQ
jgi:hypothetical protein